MRSSHTDSSVLRLLPEFGLVDLADARLGERLAETGARHLEMFAGELRRGLLAASVAIGLDVLGEMLRVDAAAAAGPKGKHNVSRTANWHGTESGRVTLRGPQGRGDATAGPHDRQSRSRVGDVAGGDVGGTVERAYGRRDVGGRVVS